MGKMMLLDAVVLGWVEQIHEPGKTTTFVTGCRGCLCQHRALVALELDAA